MLMTVMTVFTQCHVSTPPHYCWSHNTSSYNTPLTHYGLFTTPNMSIPTTVIVNQQQHNNNTLSEAQSVPLSSKLTVAIRNYNNIHTCTLRLCLPLQLWITLYLWRAKWHQSWIIHELICQGRVIGQGGNRPKLVQGIPPNVMCTWSGMGELGCH